MTVQVSGQQQQHTKLRWSRLAFTGLAIIFLIGVAGVWVANIGNLLSGVLSIVFTLLSVLIAFLQWQPQPWLRPQVLAKETSVSKQDQQYSYEQIEGVALEITRRKGALIVYTRRNLRGLTVNLSFGFHSSRPQADLASSVIGRKRNGSTIFVAVFSSLDAGNYTVHTDSGEFITKVTILPGRVEEVDWR